MVESKVVHANFLFVHVFAYIFIRPASLMGLQICEDMLQIAIMIANVLAYMRAELANVQAYMRAELAHLECIVLSVFSNSDLAVLGMP